MEDTRIDYGMSKDGIEAYTYIRTDASKNVYILSCIKTKGDKKTQYKGKEYKNLLYQFLVCLLFQPFDEIHSVLDFVFCHPYRQVSR